MIKKIEVDSNNIISDVNNKNYHQKIEERIAETENKMNAKSLVKNKFD